LFLLLTAVALMVLLRRDTSPFTDEGEGT